MLKFLNSTGKEWLGYIEKRLIQAGGEHFMAGRLSIVDTGIFQYLYNHVYLLNGPEVAAVLDEVPTLKNWVLNFPEKYPQLKQYLNTRPQYAI